MKIAVVVTNFPTLSETFIINQMAGLLERGCDLRIYCTGHVDYLAKRHRIVDRYGLMDRIVSVPHLHRSRLKRLLGAAGALVRNPSHLPLLLSSLNVFRFGRRSLNLLQFFKHLAVVHFATHDYDVVHAHFGDNGVYMEEVLRKAGQDARLVVSFHGYDLSDFDGAYYRDLFRRPDTRFTANTAYSLEKLLALGAPAEAAHVVPESLDTDYFTCREGEGSAGRQDTTGGQGDAERHGGPKGARPFEMLFVGRLVHFKNPLGAIHIAEALSNRGHRVHLTVVGSGGLYGACEAYVRERGLSEVVEMRGAGTQEEVLGLMKVADLFLFPGVVDETGRAENQGLVLQEAQALALPVVTSDVGGIPEGILDGESGYVVTSGKTEDYVDRIVSLIEDPERRREMGRMGRRYMEERYDFRVVTAWLERIYGE